MGRGKRLGPLKKDKGKVVRGDDGKAYRVSQVLACLRTGERSCWAQVHRMGRVHFSGRAFDAMPAAIFNHCTSKFFRGEVPWEARVVQVPRRVAMREAAVLADMKVAWEDRSTDEPHASADDQTVGGEVHEERHEEVTMATKGKAGPETTRKFNNETHGELLMRAMELYTDCVPETAMGWRAFAEWENVNGPLQPWAAEGPVWQERYRSAAHRWSAAGRAQMDQVHRILGLIRKHGLRMADVWGVVGDGVASRGSAAMQGRRPWPEGALARVADLFGVPEATLRDGPSYAPMMRGEDTGKDVLDDTAGAPMVATRDPVCEDAASMEVEEEQTPLEPLVGDRVRIAEDAQAMLDRLKHVMDGMTAVALYGGHLDTWQIWAVLAYLRGEDLLPCILPGVAP